MRLNKTIGEALYELFGPNGQKVTKVNGPDSLRFKAFKELERHGLVEISQTHPEYKTLFDVTRVIG